MRGLNQLFRDTVREKGLSQPRISVQKEILKSESKSLTKFRHTVKARPAVCLALCPVTGSFREASSNPGKSREVLFFQDLPEVGLHVQKVNGFLQEAVHFLGTDVTGILQSGQR